MAPASASGFKETSLKQAKTKLPPVDRETITSVLKRVIAENGRAHMRGYIFAIACLGLVAGTTAFTAWIMESVVNVKSLTADIRRASGASVIATEEGTKLAQATTRSAREIRMVMQQYQAGTEQVSAAIGRHDLRGVIERLKPS